MPPADATLPRSAAFTPVPRVVRGWGRGDAAAMMLFAPDGVEAARAALQAWDSGRGALARGMGRSYGDAAQLTNGLALDMTRLKGFDLDPASGLVTAGTGVTVGELLHALVPQGWMVPVVPGTQHVTVGGAVASDIHGKNHGSAGTLGSHVEALGLLSAGGEELELRRGDGLFEATLGGMGLTGLILWARIQMRAVTTPLLSVDTDRAKTLDDALAFLLEPGGPHRVAWLDLLGPRPVRGVVTRAEHLDAALAPAAMRGSATVASRLAVPARWPEGVVRPLTVRAFNALRYGRSPRRERGRVEAIGSHMFPLDALDAWPRLYGPHGFVQYQLVVPQGQEDVLHVVIERLRRARVPCYLAVLKDFGPANEAPLSFPIAGWTLALDLPRAAPGLWPLLDSFDELVVGAGGRVYLTKDARLRPEMTAAMYPRLAEWREVRDGIDPNHLWRSDMALRTGLVSAG